MITLLEQAPWDAEGFVDGIVRDTRLPVPDDGLLSGAVIRMGDEQTGPVIAMAIEKRIYPRKAPVHMHKSDSFRMALGEPLRVAASTYTHGEFRLQGADTFYGPELWTDEVGTNQLLLMADRRGLKPYLTTAQEQRQVDAALADDVSLEGVSMHDRDAEVVQGIVNGVGAQVRAGHLDGGFTDTGSWPELSDGSRLCVLALGDPTSGPLLLGWDRPASAVELPAFTLLTDLARLVIEGSCHLGDRVLLPRLGFRLQQAGSRHAASRPGSLGCKELWILADRTGWPPLPASVAGSEVLDEAGRLVATAFA